MYRLRQPPTAIYTMRHANIKVRKRKWHAQTLERKADERTRSPSYLRVKPERPKYLHMSCRKCDSVRNRRQNRTPKVTGREISKNIKTKFRYILCTNDDISKTSYCILLSKVIWQKCSMEMYNAKSMEYIEALALTLAASGFKAKAPRHQNTKASRHQGCNQAPPPRRICNSGSSRKIGLTHWEKRLNL